MASVTIPLVGVPNQRGTYAFTAFNAGKDQIFENVFLSVADNPITNSRSAYIEKRPGWSALYALGTGTGGSAIFYDQNLYYAILSGVTDVGIYRNGTLQDTLTSVQVSNISSGIISGELHIIFSTIADGIFYLAESAANGTTTFTADTTSGSAVLANVTVTSEFFIGQSLSGTGIAAGARISSFDAGANTVTMTSNATATNSGVTVTRSRVAKIISSNLSGTVNGVVVLDGYLFTAASDGTQLVIQHSDLNSVTNWSASSIVAPNSRTDELICVRKLGSRIVAFGERSIEFYRNAGNPSGSVLTIEKDRTIDLGLAKNGSVNAAPICEFMNSIFFQSSGVGTNTGIWQLSDSGIKKISTTFVDNILRTDAVTYVDAFMCAGRMFLHVGQTGASEVYSTFLYDMQTGFWSHSGFPHLFKIASGAQYSVGKIYGLSRDSATNGTVFQLDADTPLYQDNGVTYTLKAQTSKTDFGTEARKFISKVTLMGADIQDAVTPVELDGASGTYVSTPDSAAASITGDIECIVHVKADDYSPTGGQVFVGKRVTTGNQRSYYFGISASGLLTIAISTDGTSGTEIFMQSTTAVTTTNGNPVWFKLNIDVNDGGGNRVAKFYTSLDGSTWTQLGSTVTTAGAVTIFDSTAPLEIGSIQNGTALIFAGEIYYAEVISGIGGTVAAKFDPANDASPGDTSFTSSTGEVWTMNGTAALVNEQVATLEYSDDDYATWTTAGEFDLTQANPFIPRCGSHQAGRTWRLTHSANTAFRAQALKFDYTVGSH